MNRLISLALAAAILGGGAWWYTTRPGPAGIDLGRATAQDAAAVDTSAIQEMTLGNPEAAVTVIEYASFTCPHCRNFNETVYPQLKADYIDTGKIHFVYREVYFDRFGLWAGMLARCGGGMRYFGIADVLYDTQSEWLAGGDPAAIADNLRRIGRSAGMNDEEIGACMADEATAKAMVALYQQNATADDVTSTPTFIVNGTKYSNMGYEEFARIIDAELPEG